MRVINQAKLEKFYNRHRDAEGQVKAWLEDAQRATWPSHAFFRQRENYPNARPIKDNRVVFNIKGNNYRLIVKNNYHRGIVNVRFIGTHAEYDKIDPETI